MNDDEHSRVALRLLGAIEKHLPPEQQVAAFRAMDGEFPDRGWAEAARQQAWWFRFGCYRSWRRYHALHQRMRIACRCYEPGSPTDDELTSDAAHAYELFSYTIQYPHQLEPGPAAPLRLPGVP